MTNPEDLLREGRLTEAIARLNVILREDPTNRRDRTFLFELLCFAGEYDRAAKQLELLGTAGESSMFGALTYQAVLSAERTRQQMFEEGRLPAVSETVSDTLVSGTVNGQPFSSVTDADLRIGSSLELFAAGDYLRIPLRDIASIEMEAPKRLRDLLWAPVTVRTGPALEQRELQDVFMPVLYPLSWAHPAESVRLGRVTEWCADESGVEAPYGQRMFLVSGEEFPMLELRSLQVNVPVTAQ